MKYLNKSIKQININGDIITRGTVTRKMVPICLRASSFLNLCQNNKHEQIQNQNATAFQHLLVSNKKIDDFCQCAGITHCITAKVSNIHFKTKV